MDYTNVIKLCDENNIDYKTNLSMKDYTTFKIGGLCNLMLFPDSAEQIRIILKNIDIPYIVIGNGSNLLVDDEGVSDAVINTSGLCGISVSGNIITAGSGALLSRVSKTALAASLSGLEFAAGIPGSIGGGIYMNCGAYGGEISEVIKNVTYIDEKANVITKTREELFFDYRKSSFTNTGNIILEADFELQSGDENLIREKMNDFNRRRSDKQPVNMPSAGSVFKRPCGYFAGKLVDDAGLRGYKIGGAMVSEKHCGFIVNYDNATCGDVLNLIDYIKNTVKEKFNVELETEIKYIKGR